MDSSVTAIALEGVTKAFRFDWRAPVVRAVDDLTLRVPAGQVVGLLGPNGCGKSTTLKIMLGLIAPSRGRCQVWGQPAGCVAVRRTIGYLPEPLPLHRHLTGEEMVRYHARLAGVPRPAVGQRVREALEAVGLGSAAQRRVSTYSTGMLRRAGLAQALVHAPKLLLLDEPTAGVDPAGVEAMLQLILTQKAAGRTIVIASHLLSQIDEICDRVALLHRGRLLVEGDVRTLVGEHEQEAWVVDRLPAEERQAVHQWLAARGCRVHRSESPPRRLDHIFLRMTAEVDEAGLRSR